jgi:hypothetical protein
VDALSLHSNVANIGDVRSLVIHPASTTHAQLSPEEQLGPSVRKGCCERAVVLWMAVTSDRSPCAARLDRGEAELLPDVELAYETWGELDDRASNAVLVPHALTGDTHVTRGRVAEDVLMATTKKRSVSIARPGPTSPSHQPGASAETRSKASPR